MLLQTLQALPNPQGSPGASRSPTRSVGVVPAARFCAVTAASESSAAIVAAQPGTVAGGGRFTEDLSEVLP
jgi:hypothetical protein